MAHVYLRDPLFLLLLVVISQCKDDSPVTVPVSAYKEEDVKIPCFNSTVTDPKSCYRLKLVKYDTQAGQIVIFAWPKKNQDAQRVKWGPAESGHKSLYLTKVEKSDEGLYSCEVCQGWDCTLVKNISLKVKDCKTSSVKAAPGTTIKLNCTVGIVSGQQGRHISWAVLKGGNPVPVNLSLNRMQINDTLLIIKSVNATDSGWYRCQYKFGQTQRCIDIHLLVQVENIIQTTVFPVMPTTSQQALNTNDSEGANSEEESSGTFIAVVASVIIGIVLIAALIGLLFYCRHNNLRGTEQTQRRSPGAPWQSVDDYEDVSGQRINSLYQLYENRTLCTFQH